MRLRGQEDDQVDLRVSFEELVIIANVLSEICEGLHFSDEDFVEIFDTTRPEVETLLLRTNAILERLGLLTE